METVPESQKRVVEHVLAALPEFRHIYDEHMRDTDGELLPHVLFGDLTRWIIELYRKSKGSGIGRASASATLARALSLLETLAHSNDEAALELVSVSFLENLHQAGDDYLAMKAILGPRLREELDRVE